MRPRKRNGERSQEQKWLIEEGRLDRLTGNEGQFGERGRKARTQIRNEDERCVRGTCVEGWNSSEQLSPFMHIYMTSRSGCQYPL